MNRVEQIIAIVDEESPGNLDSLAKEDEISKEELVRKVLALSKGRMVYTHQAWNGASPDEADER